MPLEESELKHKAFDIDQDGNTAAIVDLPDQCQPLRFETPVGLTGGTATIRPVMSTGSFKQLRDNVGAQGDSYTVVADEPYRIKPELAAQIGSHFKIVFSAAQAGLQVVVWYRRLH